MSALRSNVEAIWRRLDQDDLADFTSYALCVACVLGSGLGYLILFPGLLMQLF